MKIFSKKKLLRQAGFASESFLIHSLDNEITLISSHYTPYKCVTLSTCALPSLRHTDAQRFRTFTLLWQALFSQIHLAKSAGVYHSKPYNAVVVLALEYLPNFLNSCMRQLKIPKIWRRALVVAIPKPEKPLGDPKSYRPISLLCVPFKIVQRLMYARVETITDPLLPQ